jgi:two-component system, OmpR family, sensor histidine kinase KdpD
MSVDEPDRAATGPSWPHALAVWAAGWVALVMLEPRLDLANLAMLLVLVSTLATLWQSIGVSLVLTTAAVAAFNWFFVPPRYTFAVDLNQHAWLLLAMLAVSWIVAAAMARQRLHAQRAAQATRRLRQLQQFGEALRDAAEPAQQAGLLQQALASLFGQPARLLVLRGARPPGDDDAAALLLGEPSAHERSGLWQCLRQGQPFGPGTGRHAELHEWYFPLRGRREAYGAAMVPLADDVPDEAARTQAQALCDQMGSVLQRAQAQRAADGARDEAQLQQVRNAMLAAISHDYRTPLASIMGAASSLRDQHERLDAAQRRRLLDSVVAETEQLARLADNTLQLARLDAPGVTLAMDWESAEELAGAVRARFALRDPQPRVRVRIEPGVPLVRCDALLMAQLLENLIENALKYSEAPAPVELLVRRQPGHVVFAVRDRGPGIEPAWRERIFDVFQRGTRPAVAGAPRGAGVGLAVCRAIARAHGGELKLRPRGHGGASFECWLPEPAEAPPVVPEAAST